MSTPPPIQNPYGRPPHEQPASPQHGFYQHGGYPQGPYQPVPQWTPPERVKQPDSRPGRFLWWDLLPTVPYVVLFFGLPLFFTLVFGRQESTGGEAEAGMADPMLVFLENAIIFGGIFALCLLVSGKALLRSTITFTHRAIAWLKLLLIPAIWFGVILANLFMTLVIWRLTGQEPDTSANQAGIEEMTGVVPFWAALAIFGLIGPYVEEYFFRHLLVGKLSRHLNIWICGVISVAIFAFMHVAVELFSGDWMLLLLTVVPYLTMSVAFTVAYILTGRSLAFVWLLHAFNNCVALLVTYYVLPWAEELEGQLEAVLRVLPL
ncbi:CPBP family intramembrane glutamic endopeptidase [Nesterenkonia flava]|uniref:CPBP family glutamic-type intramembrane protease n=1 Tax=Nesterenkonia flava TaxID=469799 RepID=A0ABU1FTN4_9MICC|nr:CPBP family glutamic-type intramembrane protease [Nesterenkonia flava]MDR5711543.1 CPBP family glutamic-type intramembrane protease [Nesterenkonia flava]